MCKYFLPVSNTVAYVSQWGKDGLNGSLARIDLATNKVVKVIPVGTGPEKMILADANIEDAVNGAAFGCFANSGQICTALLMPSSIGPIAAAMRSMPIFVRTLPRSTS